MTETTAAAISLNDCDREPIHIPEAIQPHGILFLIDPGEQTVLREAGLLSSITGGSSWLGQPVSAVIGEAMARRLRAVSGVEGDGFVGRWMGVNRLEYDVIARANAAGLIVEIEQSSQAAQLGVELIARLDAAGVALERASSVRGVCEAAAEAFRRLTGFDRVMIYRFLEDDAGQVVAESRDPEVPSFQNHHFPATDIPRQARALYVRNPVRVIPDARYSPQPLLPASPG
jgi:light-regulated signal transduction histidine kinase (bacteriophytochrome)